MSHSINKSTTSADNAEHALHTQADNIAPLTEQEAQVMGRQVVKSTDKHQLQETIYGDVDSSYENEDQVNAHQAGPDEHL